MVYRSIEAAVQLATEFFGEDSAIDRPLFPNLVRYYVKLDLSRRGLQVVDDDEPHFQHKILANNGLYLTYGDRRARILKADNGCLPAPGASIAKQHFYDQGTLFQGTAVPHQNLVFLWDVVRGALDLHLVCPRDGDQRTSAIHWMVEVQHPGEVYEAPEPKEESFEFDIPITIPESAADDE